MMMLACRSGSRVLALLGLGPVALLACGGSTPPAQPAPAPATEPPAATASAAPTEPASAPDSGTASAAEPAPAAGTASAAAPAPAPAEDSASDAASAAYMESVQILYKSQRDALTKGCWEKSKSTEHAYAGKATIRVSPQGKALSVKMEGTDDPANACLEKQLKKWKYPPSNGTATVSLPIRLHREALPAGKGK